MKEISLEQKRIEVLNEYILKNSLQVFMPYYNKNEDEMVIIQNININRDEIVNIYIDAILSVIACDEFEDGEISKSERYMRKNMSLETKDYILDALMKIYMDKYNNEHVLLGIMEMISCMKYEEVEPKGQIMALGLLQHENIYLRDRAIQVYEQWNSKKSLTVLKSLKCDQKWLQDYVDKVIEYLERGRIIWLIWCVR
jgi:hypothetical protein